MTQYRQARVVPPRVCNQLCALRPAEQGCHSKFSFSPTRHAYFPLRFPYGCCKCYTYIEPKSLKIYIFLKYIYETKQLRYMFVLLSFINTKVRKNYITVLPQHILQLLQASTPFNIKSYINPSITLAIHSTYASISQKGHYNCMNPRSVFYSTFTFHLVK